MLAAVVNPAGTICGKAWEKTPKGGCAQQVAECMARVGMAAVASAGCSVGEIASVGVGSPGTVDPQEGIISRWYKMGFENVPIKALLSSYFKQEVYL